MKYFCGVSSGILTALIFFCSAAAAVAQSSGKAPDIPNSIYLSIEKLSLKWTDGLFGSGLFYAHELENYLYQAEGRIISTPYIFSLAKPYDSGNVRFYCTFLSGAWLEVGGYVEKSHYALILKNVLQQENGWLRFSCPVSVSGKIKKFTLDSSSQGKRLILILDGIQFQVQPASRSGI